VSRCATHLVGGISAPQPSAGADDQGKTEDLGEQELGPLQHPAERAGNGPCVLGAFLLQELLFEATLSLLHHVALRQRAPQLSHMEKYLLWVALNLPAAGCV